MKFSEALRETMFRFRITGVELAAKSELTPAQINQFCNDRKDLNVKSLDRIVAALTPEQRSYLVQCVVLKED